MTTARRCAFCSATVLVRLRARGEHWCGACLDACETTRRSLHLRLRQALAAGDEGGARIVQGALLFLLRGLHPRAPR